MQRDVHSFAKPAEARVSHLSLAIEVDFERRVLEGSVQLALVRTADAQEVVLDTKNLSIREVSVSADAKMWQPAAYTLGNEDEILGAPLAISLAADTQYVQVEYASRPTAEALQWVEPQQTAGKKHPFLLTQSQAINARTWVPIQDSPGIRFTYEATVKVPSHLLPLMSASNPEGLNASGVYHFSMPQPIPAYLLALCVGNIERREISARTAVYAEPETLALAASELSDLEAMVQTAESLYGAYAWDRYDVVFMPPSFPFGGMENPRLTFATPTILAGDKSLVSLVAHELAHSWSGNLVTNATWNDFWINEGFTVYFEMRIMEALYGREYAEMLALLAYQDLAKTVAATPEPDTWLKLDLAGRNPDDGVSPIAYDKGYYLLRLIEQTVGRDRWDAWVRAYFQENAFRSMDTDGLIHHLYKAFPELLPERVLEQWIFAPGLPKAIPVAQSDRFVAVEFELEQWETGNKTAQMLQTEGWSAHEWVHFLRHIAPEISVERFSELDEAFGFTQSTNAEIQAIWYLKAIEHGYSEAIEAMRSFMLAVGRRKMIVPLYKALMQRGAEGLADLAKEIYAEARPNYHPITTQTVDALVRGV